MNLDGNQRRKAFIEYLNKQNGPISGSELARRFGVSRQIIVQDVALLRAQNCDIVSTNKGYLLRQPFEKRGQIIEEIMVTHTSEDTIKEMEAIVDYGGSMLDVSVDHEIYGLIRIDLIINDKLDAEEFCQKLANSHSKPLKVLTENHHYHTIVAPSQKAMDLIKNDLREKGFLVSD